MKQLLTLIFGLSALVIAGTPAAQERYPESPIRLVVGFPPGSQPDIVARLLAKQLNETLGQPVVVENIAGAAGNIAAERLAKAAPDGYTVGLLSQTHIVINPHLYRLGYDPVKDFAPVSQLTVSPNVLVVNTAIPAASVKELVALAKAAPGGLTFASSGSGTGTHIAAELFMSAAGVDIRHIPYKGVVAAIPDLVAGRVAMMFSTIPVALPLVREGKLRALAVTSLQRSPAVPEIPTVAEAGYPDFEATNWYGLFVPAGTSASIVHRLHAATSRALERADVRSKLTGLGMQVIGSSPDEFATMIKADMQKWSKVIDAAHIKPD